MTGIVVAGHGHFADGIMSAVELVAGVPEEVLVVNFEEGEGIEDLRLHMLEAIAALKSEDILLLVDLLGGSPFNVVTQLLMEHVVEKNLRVIAGANMATVVQAIFAREMLPFEELTADVIRAGKEGIVNVTGLLQSE